MSYLLSLLTGELPEKDNSKVLCYYVNKTDAIQLIYVRNETNDEIHSVVFPKESILFLAFSSAHLEVNSFRINERILTKIPCQSLNLHQDFVKHKTAVNPSLIGE